MQKIYCIDEDGIHGLWDDDLCVGLGEAKNERASDVEPTPDGKWVVRLKWPRHYLCEGFTHHEDIHYAKKFDRRDNAIAYEIEFFNKKLLQTGDMR